jgi:hypothetical protein
MMTLHRYLPSRAPRLCLDLILAPTLSVGSRPTSLQIATFVNLTCLHVRHVAASRTRFSSESKWLRSQIAETGLSVWEHMVSIPEERAGRDGARLQRGKIVHDELFESQKALPDFRVVRKRACAAMVGAKKTGEMIR